MFPDILLKNTVSGVNEWLSGGEVYSCVQQSPVYKLLIETLTDTAGPEESVKKCVSKTNEAKESETPRLPIIELVCHHT